jgi:hypothetical protein
MHSHKNLMGSFTPEIGINLYTLQSNLSSHILKYAFNTLHEMTKDATTGYKQDSNTIWNSQTHKVQPNIYMENKATILYIFKKIFIQ